MRFPHRIPVPVCVTAVVVAAGVLAAAPTASAQNVSVNQLVGQRQHSAAELGLQHVPRVRALAPGLLIDTASVSAEGQDANTANDHARAVARIVSGPLTVTAQLPWFRAQPHLHSAGAGRCLPHEDRDQHCDGQGARHPRPQGYRRRGHRNSHVDGHGLTCTKASPGRPLLAEAPCHGYWSDPGGLRPAP